jgi:hypothetical protein
MSAHLQDEQVPRADWLTGWLAGWLCFRSTRPGWSGRLSHFPPVRTIMHQQVVVVVVVVVLVGSLVYVDHWLGRRSTRELLHANRIRDGQTDRQIESLNDDQRR